jgi:hypothetical protein
MNINRDMSLPPIPKAALLPTADGPLLAATHALPVGPSRLSMLSIRSASDAANVRPQRRGVSPTTFGDRGPRRRRMPSGDRRACMCVVMARQAGKWKRVMPRDNGPRSSPTGSANLAVWTIVPAMLARSHIPIPLLPPCLDLQSPAKRLPPLPDELFYPFPSGVTHCPRDVLSGMSSLRGLGGLRHDLVVLGLGGVAASQSRRLMQRRVFVYPHMTPVPGMEPHSRGPSLEIPINGPQGKGLMFVESARACSPSTHA